MGEPWNSRAVENGVGCIVVFGSELNRASRPTRSWRCARAVSGETGAVHRLLRAYQGGGALVRGSGNRANLAQMLSRPEYLNVAPKTVLNALTGTLPVNRTEARSASDFLAFQGDDINWPDPRKARWLYAEIATGLRQPLDESQAEAAAAVFRPDVFDAATGNNALPEAHDPIGLRFGPAFNSTDLKGYIDALMRS